MKQTSLFASAPAGLPDGFRYEPDFLDADEERALVERFASLPFAEARYREFTARRRIVSYGHSYDFTAGQLLEAEPIPPWLLRLRERVAGWAGHPAESYVQALVAEYSPGTPLGWHRDVPDFERIAAVSFGGSCRMRLRPWPHRTGSRVRSLSVTLEPRSIYALEGVARWKWQHGISPTRELRWSISFRSRSAFAPRSRARAHAGA